MTSENKKAAFIHSPQMEKFSYPPGFPFNVTRAAQVRKILNSNGLLSGPGITEVPPIPADQTTLEKFHTSSYLNTLKSAAQGNLDPQAFNMGIGTPDCPVFPDMYDYSAWACGATVTGANLIISGDADIAYNPSGGLHHAMSERASGFCYMNDMAIGCIILAEAGKKVLYLDVDVHHGDGPAYAFYDRSDIMTISFHQNPRTLFPGTGFENEIGTGPGKGYCINVPLPIGTYDTAYLQAFDEIALPLIKAFDPGVFVCQFGADALASDPLAQLFLTNNVYVDIINSLLSFDKPVLAAGGGGYDIENTVKAWALVWCVLCNSTDDQNKNLQSQLLDKELTVSSQQRNLVTQLINAVIERIKTTVFPIHGL